MQLSRSRPLLQLTPTKSRLAICPGWKKPTHVALDFYFWLQSVQPPPCENVVAFMMNSRNSILLEVPGLGLYITARPLPPLLLRV